MILLSAVQTKCGRYRHKEPAEESRLYWRRPGPESVVFVTRWRET